MNIVKCPNPTCPFQFDATLVPPGAVIACPQCRLQFQLPQVAAAPPPAAEPEVLETDAPPADDTPPRAERRRDRDRDRKDDDGKGKRRSRDRDDDDDPPKRGGNTALLLVVLAVGVALICGGAVTAIVFALGGGKQPANTSPYTYPDYALSYSGPGTGWEEDKETQSQWKFKLAGFKSQSPEAYIAVQVMKTEGEAGKGDLLPAAAGVLKDKFDDLDDKLSPTEAKLLGVTAEMYDFFGVYNGSPTKPGCRGEVYAVAVRNLKVWVYCWAERDRFDDMKPTFAAFRAGMKLDAKPNEPKVQRTTTEFRTNSGLYTLTDTEGIWKKNGDPTLQDAAGDLWLAGSRRNPVTGKVETATEVNLLVAIVDAKGDAKTQAKEHIIAQDTDGGVVNEQAGDPVGESPSSGPVAASDEVVRFTKKYPNTTGSADKLMVFKAVDSGGKRVIAYAWCQPKQAGYWEQRLMLLVGTLKPLK